MGRPKLGFLSGLPRAGNTLLSSILNQNPKIEAGPNSILPEALWRLWTLQEHSTMRMFPDKEAWAAMIRGVASSYYSVSEASFVLDRGPWGTPANLGILREFIDPQAKFLVLLRPVEEVVASFMRLNKVHDEAARDSLMKEIWDPNSVLSLGLWSSRNLVENAKDQTLVVHYHDFVKDPSLELERVYDFFGLQRFRHDFTAFTQLEVRGVKYNDDAHTAHNTHLVKTDGLFPSVLEPSEYLDYGAIEEMRKLNFWDS